MKTGRNNPCPCGSGKKYKRCCLSKDESRTTVYKHNTQADVGGTDNHSTPHPPSISLDPQDVMSPQYWDTMEKQLPSKKRKEWAPMISQIKEAAAYEQQRLEIETASNTLEKYRRKYERLMKNEKKLLRLSEKLFSEQPFESMRFSANDLQKAFEKIGFPPMSHNNDMFFDIIYKTINWLVDDKERDQLARRLMCLLPDFVKSKRYIDAWIIQHNAVLLENPPEIGCSPFLLCMFAHGMNEWEDKRDSEQRELFYNMGITPDEIQQKGYEGMESMIREMMTDRNKTEEIEKFLDAHPELKAMSNAQCLASEDAAVDLLQREDATSLFLSANEIKPWLTVFDEKLSQNPDILKSMQESANPDENAEKKLVKLIYSICCDMAEALFTPTRLNQLIKDIHNLRCSLPKEDSDSMAGINGALVATQSTVPASENHFLIMLCWSSTKSLMDAMK